MSCVFVRLQGRIDGHASRLSATRIELLRGGCCSNRVPSRCYRSKRNLWSASLKNSLILLPRYNRTLWSYYPWILFYVFSLSTHRVYILRLYHLQERWVVKLSGNIWRTSRGIMNRLFTSLLKILFFIIYFKMLYDQNFYSHFNGYKCSELNCLFLVNNIIIASDRTSSLSVTLAWRRHFDSVLWSKDCSQATWIQCRPSHNVHCNIIFPSTSRFTEWSLL
jgi:hypothetical protein